MLDTKDEMYISNRPKIKVYYEYNRQKNNFSLYERESFFDEWRYINTFKTLEEVQEAARSRAITVVEMGLFENGHRKGMMDWFKEPRPVRKIPEFSANFNADVPLEVEKKFRRKEIR